MEIKYLNTDFEIESREDVSRIVEEFGDDVAVLYHENIRGYYSAGFEVESGFQGADEAINQFCHLVEQLPPGARRVWDGCVSRIVDVGIESGESPPNYRAELRASTVQRVAAIGCSIIVTVYPRYIEESEPQPNL